MSVTTERPPAGAAPDNTVVESSFSAVIHAPIEKVDIPDWCFSLPDSEYQACSSGFANTDLDQQLKAHGTHRLIVIGLITNTCVEATVRFGAELGYDVTVVRDATASYSEEEMHATLDLNLPNYASAIVTTSELLESISSGRDDASGSLAHALH